MSKYHDLVEEYSGWIQCIKSQQALVAEMKMELKEAQAMNDDPHDWAYLASDLGDVEAALQDDLHALKHDIEREYELVPFKASRNTGISGFWREAGLRMPS